MKLLKKSDLGVIDSSGVTSPFLSSDSTHIDTFLSDCLHDVENLSKNLHGLISIDSQRKHTLLGYITRLILKWRLGNLGRKITEANRVLTGRAPVSTNVIPLIKEATTAASHDISKNLAGRSILCVGGRMALYPSYRCFVEALGGNIIIFRGNTNNNFDLLYKLLEDSDMVICPVDCVNHEDFFTVKRYCKTTGKPCVLMDHSRVTTFRKGIQTLANIAKCN